MYPLDFKIKNFLNTVYLDSIVTYYLFYNPIVQINRFLINNVYYGATEAQPKFCSLSEEYACSKNILHTIFDSKRF
jgi:hypothetical protein